MDILTGVHIIKSGGCMLSGPVTFYRKPRRETEGDYLWYNIFWQKSNGILPGVFLQVPGQFVNGEYWFVSFGTSSIAF